MIGVFKRFLLGMVAAATGLTPTEVVADTAAPASRPFVDRTRASRIEGWLAPRPLHFTPAFSDREFWEPISKTPAAESVLAAARKASREPAPALPDELYNVYRATGERSSYEKPANLRTERLAAFVIAEGLVNDGSWTTFVESELAAILDEPAWAVPAHATRTRPTRSDSYDFVDLAAAARAWLLATADHLLGERLDSSLRKRLRDETRARVLDPWLRRARAGDRGDFWWMNAHNNWNAVCNAGVVGAALLLVEDPAERAEFVSAYENLGRSFIDGFADDGFCHEGIAYWSYGFGHYVMGAELVRLNTGGRVDLLSPPKIARIAAFAANWEIAGGVFPTFGDSWPRTRVPSWMAPFIEKRFGAPCTSDNTLRLQHRHGLGSQLYAVLFGLAHPPSGPAGVPLRDLPPRGWFPDGGALVSRSVPAHSGLSVALKGGHNAQAHNHNDLGSFIVARDGVVVIADFGADDYVKDTFGPLRYTSGVMNSFGHSVPRVAGRLQKTGARARAVTVRVEFTDDADLWELDLTSAYEVPELKRLTRTFLFSRADGGRLEIVDRVRFSSPQAFGNALFLMLGQQREDAHASGFRLTADGKTVNVAYQATGGELTLNEEPVLGIGAGKPRKGTRLGFEFANPVSEAEIRLVITP